MYRSIFAFLRSRWAMSSRKALQEGGGGGVEFSFRRLNDARGSTQTISKPKERRPVLGHSPRTYPVALLSYPIPSRYPEGRRPLPPAAGRGLGHGLACRARRLRPRRVLPGGGVVQAAVAHGRALRPAKVCNFGTQHGARGGGGCQSTGDGFV